MLPRKKRKGGYKTSCFVSPLWQQAKTAEFFHFSPNLKLSYRALGMSVFIARRTVGKEIVYTFQFLIDHIPPRYVHTCGTQKAHHIFFKNASKTDVPHVCLMCAYNVPDVCTYWGTPLREKYRLSAFQRRVVRVFTTKTRFSSSI